MKFHKSLVSVLQILMGVINIINGCNFGVGNLGFGNAGVGNVGFFNKGFLNFGLQNYGFAQKGIRNIGALNFFPIPNTISVFNVPVAPNLSFGRRRRRSTLKYANSRTFRWTKN